MPLTLEEALGQINKNVDEAKSYALYRKRQIDTTESILNAIPSYRDKIERFAKGFILARYNKDILH